MDLQAWTKKDRDFEEITAAQKERNMHILVESIRNNLKKPFHYFSYNDIVRCAWQNGWNTQKDVDEALQTLGLSKEDFT